jgi:hypothetical protein
VNDFPKRGRRPFREYIVKVAAFSFGAFFASGTWSPPNAARAFTFESLSTCELLNLIVRLPDKCVELP